MLSLLLNKTAYLLKPTATFNGLGDEVSEETTYRTFPCRLRELSAREQFERQGDVNVSTHRVYAEGNRADFPTLSTQSVLQIDSERYQVQTITEGQTNTAHHLQMDCVKTEGV